MAPLAAISVRQIVHSAYLRPTRLTCCVDLEDSDRDLVLAVLSVEPVPRGTVTLLLILVLVVSLVLWSFENL